MSSGSPLFRATKVAYPDFKAAEDIVGKAEAQARSLLQDARTQAEAIVGKAEARRAEIAAELDATRQRHRLAQQDAELRFENARRMANMMRDASEIRKEFDTLSPWLSKLMESCFARLIGAIDNDKLMAGIISRGIAELKADYTLALRVYGGDHASILELKAAYPAAFTAISKIIPDSSVAPGEVQIDGAGGLITLGKEQAKAALIQSLRDVLAHEQTVGRTAPC